MLRYSFAMTNASIDTAKYAKMITSAKSEEELANLEQELFGRKQGVATLAMKELSSLSPEEKKKQGQALNVQKKELEQALEEKRSALEREAMSTIAESDKIDTSLELPRRSYGHVHPIPEFIAKVEEVFGRMGFDTAYGPEIEEEELNFDMLNMPKDHPARDGQDTFWMGEQNGKGYVLRTHTSPVQIRYMRERTPPFRAIFPGKTYRKDDDATHSPMFHQFEGLMIGKDISIAHLKGVLTQAMQELISPDITFRFRTAYFPFVEPGLEMDIRWQGDLSESKEGKWLEMGGCGMVHPEVLKNGGIDPHEWQGFAFGFGIERPLMIKYQIPDLRSFFEGNLAFLEQF